MTNEEAIKWLKDYIKNGYFSMPQYREALELAIKALSSWEEYSDKLWETAYERGKAEAKDE